MTDITKFIEDTCQLMKTLPINKTEYASYKSELINPEFINTFKSLPQEQLPEYVCWKDINLEDSTELQHVANFINHNYMNKKLQPYIDASFLSWILNINKNNRNYCFGIFSKTNNSIYGIICCNLVKDKINNDTFTTCEPIVLCVNNKFKKTDDHYGRKLVKELARRLAVDGITCSFYHATEPISYRFSSITKYSRPINLKKLLTIGYVQLIKDTSDDTKNAKEEAQKAKDTMKQMIRRHHISKDLDQKYKPMEKEHIEKLYELYNTYIVKYNFNTIYTLDEFKNLLLNDNVKTYVIMSAKSGIVDFISYYIVNYRANEKTNVSGATLLMYTSNRINVYSLILNLCIICKLEGIDILNVFDTLEHEIILRDLMFEKYSIEEYYVAGYRIKKMKPNEINKQLVVIN